jgi:hypothetical protein
MSRPAAAGMFTSPAGGVRLVSAERSGAAALLCCEYMRG